MSEKELKELIKRRIKCDDIIVIDNDINAVECGLAKNEYFNNAYTVRVQWDRFAVVEHISKHMLNGDEALKRLIIDSLVRAMMNTEKSNKGANQ